MRIPEKIISLKSTIWYDGRKMLKLFEIKDSLSRESTVLDVGSIKVKGEEKQGYFTLQISDSSISVNIIS